MKTTNRKIVLLKEGVVFDAFVLYQFIKKLTTPFKDTEAFKLGIIDDDGKVLRKRNTLKTPEEKSAYTIFDTFVFNIKKLLEKVPGGKSALASYIAALFLLKESNNAESYQDEDMVYEAFSDYFEDIMADKKSFQSLRKFLIEEKKVFSREKAKEIGDSLNVDWDKVDLGQFVIGLGVESEHDQGDELDVVDSLRDLGKIVLAHLRELPDYYDKLKKVEEDAPANSAGGGGIAGLPPDSPPVNLKKRKKKTSFRDFSN